MIGESITVPLPPPTKPIVEPKADDTPIQSAVPLPYSPPAPLDINKWDVRITTGTTMSDESDIVIKTQLPTGSSIVGAPSGSGTGAVVKLKPALPDLIAAKPRNDPGSWIINSDYRSSWIAGEWTGTARFTVTIGTSGRVKDCQIVQSTGHDALDTATCDLVTRRARLDPARNGSRDKVSGKYTSEIRWELPR